jgi:hypothetical protein
VNQEIRNRVRLTVAAYAYEFRNDSLMTDHEFDALALKIDPTISTGNKKLDEFFRTEFAAFSGVWVRNHPDLGSVRKMYESLKQLKRKSYDQTFNVDLFGPLLNAPVRTKKLCGRCGGGVSDFPADGGCHC